MISSANVDALLWETKTIAPDNLFRGNVPHSFVKDKKKKLLKHCPVIFLFHLNNVGLSQLKN